MNSAGPPLQRTHARWSERAIEAVLLLSALSVVAVTLAIVGVLLAESAAFFADVPWRDFLFGTQWTPLFEAPRFGVLPLLTGTLVSTAIALAFAAPFGVLVGLWLSEFASPRVREAVKPVLELVAGVPTVVFGYFALLAVTPLLQRFVPGLAGYNLLAPGLMLGVMILPLVATLTEDAMRAVPMRLREASFGLGASRLQTSLYVVLPAAASGVLAALLLGASRAMGETMVVAIAGGAQPNLTWNPTESAASIASFIAHAALGDLPHDSLAYRSLFAAGLLLFASTLALNAAGHAVKRRWREYA